MVDSTSTVKLFHWLVCMDSSPMLFYVFAMTGRMTLESTIEAQTWDLLGGFPLRVWPDWRELPVFFEEWSLGDFHLFTLSASKNAAFIFTFWYQEESVERFFPSRKKMPQIQFLGVGEIVRYYRYACHPRLLGRWIWWYATKFHMLLG